MRETSMFMLADGTRVGTRVQPCTGFRHLALAHVCLTHNLVSGQCLEGVSIIIVEDNG